MPTRNEGADGHDADGVGAHALVAAVQRVVTRSVRDPNEAEDLVQETLRRVVAKQDHLDGSARLPYAVVTARNVVVDHHRRTQRESRYLPTLVDLRSPPVPEDEVVSHEEQVAVAAALDRLRPRERRALTAHTLEGASTAQLAEREGSSPGAVAVNLASARARMRVEYLLALRRVDVPTDRCRPVLVSLSAGDQRRQRALGADDHILSCETCADLSEPVLSRQRRLAFVWPPVVAVLLARRLAGWARSHPVQAVAIASTSAVVLGGASYVVLREPGPPPVVPSAAATTVAIPSPPAPPAPDARLMAGGRPLLEALEAGDLPTMAGRRVQAEGVAVESVPADEGFWVGTSPTRRVWVQLIGGGESPQGVTSGERVSFTGTLRRVPPGMGAAVGVDRAEGSDQLAAQAHFIEVRRPVLREESGA